MQKRSVKLVVIFATLFFSLNSAYSQGSTCANIQPFCADDGSSGIVFANTSNRSRAENGPNYGCLAIQPNPAWYFLQVDNGGDLNLTIIQNTNQNGTGAGLDVDFIAWGPFTDTNVCSAADLSAANQVDCSFLPDFQENVSIPNTMPGEIYILMITNFDGRPGFISLENDPGGATTDCSIVAGNLGLDQFPCEGDTITLDGTTDGAILYSWFRNGTLLVGEDQPTLTVNVSGTYEVEVTDNMANSDTDEIVITFVETPIANTPNDLSLCVDNTGDTGTFNLAQNTATILGAINPLDFNVTFHNSQANADNSTNALPENYTTNMASEQIFVRVENRLNTGCADTTSFNLFLNTTPELVQVSDIILCDDDLDGDDTNGLIQNIDLSQKDNEISNGQTDVIITYYNTLTDANNNTNLLGIPYANNANNEIIFFRIEDQNTQCFSTGSFNLIINPALRLQDTTLEQCDGIDGVIDGIAQFNLEEATTDIISTGVITDYTFSYFITLVDAQNNTNPQQPLPFINTQANQTIFVRATFNTTSCFAIAEVILATTNTIVPNATLMECNNSGFTEFNLSEADAQILDPTIPINSIVTYYETLEDAQLETNALANLFTNTIANTQTIYSRVEDGNACFGIGEVVLNINMLPNLNLEDSLSLCVNENNITSIDTGLTTAAYSFQWMLNGVLLTTETNGSINVTEEGVYEVTATNIITGCSNTDSSIVSLSSPPSNLTITNISEAFSGNSSVTVSVEGIGDYTYQINNEPVQLSPVFTNLPSGTHIITVCDSQGCGCDSIEVFLIDYPRFFTPNGDGFNDTWNIEDVPQLTQVNITIYDRYGKLLKNITPQTAGWDGIFNGQRLPETDYWFRMDYIENNESKQLRANFSLKR